MNTGVRLAPSETKIIIDTITNACAKSELIRIAVYGSRADLTKKGGDIDLLVEINKSEHDIETLKSLIRTELFKKLGEQKIDLFIWQKELHLTNPRRYNFYKIIEKEAVDIWRDND